MLSNVRGEPGYPSGLSNQTHTPKPEMKMPPVGNFAPPPSAGKESKKRRGGPSQMTIGAAAPESVSGPSNQNNRMSNVRGGASSNKVSAVDPELSDEEWILL